MPLPPVPDSKFPRDQAIWILSTVVNKRLHLDDVLEGVSTRVMPEARTWLLEVCAGVLRYRGRLEWILDQLCDKARPKGELRKILVLGLYQILGQERTDPASVVHETVEWVKTREGLPASKFANAILRRVLRELPQWKVSEAPRQDALSDWWSLPKWLWDRCRGDWGDAWAKGFAAASLDRPKTWIRAKNPPSWAEAGPIPQSYLVAEGSGSIAARPGFREGAFFVQDISSQTLIHEVCEILNRDAPEVKRALDLCAAPGGKAVGLQWNGLEVLATDFDPGRYRLLEESSQRVTGGKLNLVPWDRVQQAVRDVHPELIWVDAPCSGTGVLRRNPEIRWNRTVEDVANLAKLQREIVLQAWELVPIGGYLLYSVCSILKQEGPHAALEGLAFETLKEWTLSPHVPPFGDGFLAALVKKTG